MYLLNFDSNSTPGESAVDELLSHYEVLKMTHPFIHSLHELLYSGAHGLYVHPMLPSTCTSDVCVFLILRKLSFTVTLLPFI